MKTISIKNIIRHVLIVVTGVFLILGLPFLRTDYYAGLVSGEMDALSSATVVLDEPSGNYVVLLNTAMHTDADNLEDWITFFSGGEILYIFEDISCSVADGDEAGLEMAQSLQSRLPENQMSLQKENPTLLASRIDYDKYDVVIMSQEFADSYQVEITASDNTQVIYLLGGESE